MNIYRCNVCGEVYIGQAKPVTCPFCGAHQDYFVLASKWTLLKAKNLSDVTRDNLYKALDLEIDNTNFYKSVSERTKDIFIEGMFKGLSKVEREHASTICKHLGIAKPDSNVGSDKAVDSDEQNKQEADRREKRAVRLYGQALSVTQEPQIKEFFKALVQIESDHIILLEQK